MSPRFKKYYVFSVASVLLASAYPLYMGARVVIDMLRHGTVLGENYPKYVIPYTPISLAVIVSVLLLPIIIKVAKRLALLLAAVVSSAVFFVSELLLESEVIVTTTLAATLESWQMYMCYIPPELYESRDWRAVDVLMGDYSPTFKIHFYMISIVLILSILNCVYGFAQMIAFEDNSRRRALKMQSVSALLFLGLCILACFTSFYRTGSILVSPISAVLMVTFFIVLGICTGIFLGSLLLKKRWLMSVLLPALVSSAATLAMYLGEMFLLSGYLYRFGTGWFFEGLAGISLAPVDIWVVAASGIACALIMKLTRRPQYAG